MEDDHQEGSPSLDDILSRDFWRGGDSSDPHNQWPEVTAENVSVLHLSDCLEQLERSEQEPIRVVQAAKSAHLALQAALTAALAGSMGIGAYSNKDRIAWLEFLQNGGEQPADSKVMSFPALLARAMSEKLEWTQRPLAVSDEAQGLLRKLTFLRHRMEHPRPGFWLVEPAYVLQVLPLAAGLTMEALESVYHHFEAGELEQVKRTVEAIYEFCNSEKLA